MLSQRSHQFPEKIKSHTLVDSASYGTGQRYDMSDVIASARLFRKIYLLVVNLKTHEKNMRIPMGITFHAVCIIKYLLFLSS